TPSLVSNTGESALSCTAPTKALHTFTLDSGASRSFFGDSNTLTPLSRLVAVSLADPSGGPVLAHSSTVLPCPAAPSGLLSGLHLPSFSMNLVSGADLQDAWVDQFTPGGQRVTHCTCSRTGRHLATFTRQPVSSLYTLTTASPPITASGQVAASSQVFAAASRSSPTSAPCSYRPLSHETLLWHHRLGHPSLPRLRGMASQAPLQPLHMDVWGPARVRGQGHERYFLLVVDDYSRYTTVFPLRSKGDDTKVLIDWIRGARGQLGKSFGSDLPVLRLHSDRGGEFSSDLLRAFCREEGIRQTFTLPASPQKNGIAERRIGMVMDVARTSMIHAAAPHFLWPFAVQYAAYQINLQPRVSLPETRPTLRWTGKVGDASVSRVRGSRAFVRDTSADKLSSRAVPYVFLGFPPDTPGWQFYHPTSRRILSSQDVMFDESVSCYRLFQYRTASLPSPPLFLAPGTPLIDPFPPQGPVPSGVSQVDPAELVEVAVDSGAARGVEPAGAGTGGAEPKRAESGGAESGRAEPGGAEPKRVQPGGTASGGAELACTESGGSLGLPSRREPLSPQQLCEWYARCCRGAAGAAGAVGAAGAAGGAAGAAEGAAGARAAGGTAGAGAAGAAGGAAGDGAAGGAAGAGAAVVVAGDPAVSRGAARRRPYYVPLLQQGLGLPPSPGPPPFLLSPPLVQSQSQLQPASPLPCPSPYSGPTRGLTEHREPESRPLSPDSRFASPVRTVRVGRRVSRPRPPPVSGTHSMTLRPSTAPQRVPLPSPPASSIPDGPDPESDSLRAASPAVTRFLATAVTDPLLESTAASALVAELVDFAAACRLDCARRLVAETDKRILSAVPHLVSMLLAPEGDPDAPDIPILRSYAEAIKGPYSSQWQADMDAEMASWKSTGTYAEEVPPPRANIVSGMWIFRVKGPPSSPPVFKRDYELHSLDFNTAFLQGSLPEEIWLRRPPSFTGSFPAAPFTGDPSLFLRTNTTLPPFNVLVYVDDLVFATADTDALAHVKSELQKRHTCADLGELTSYLGLRITRDRAQRTITLTQSHIVQQVLLRFGFTYSSPQSTPLPTGHSLSAPPSDESVDRVVLHRAWGSCLEDGLDFSSLVTLTPPGSSCEAEIYAGAMAAQELRWLTYLLSDLGEAPRSPPVLYVDKKAMLALYQEHRLEHRTKHIALRYFLA
ncbi:unnamed protein product, partial [Closterium sp. NIES-53]